MGSTGKEVTWEVYPFGNDPGWAHTANKLNSVNSFKMKFAIVAGVVQMVAGVCCKLMNTLYFKVSAPASSCSCPCPPLLSCSCSCSLLFSLCASSVLSRLSRSSLSLSRARWLVCRGSCGVLSGTDIACGVVPG
eukprot:3793017-Rhodomonas_salina.2